MKKATAAAAPVKPTRIPRKEKKIAQKKAAGTGSRTASA
jgi:hypothetical protein